MRAIRLWVAALVVSVACVTVLERIFVLRWWHPACASSDGSSPYAIGFPLPYSQWTGASSLEYWASIPALLFNVCVFSVPLYFLIKWLFNIRSRYRVVLRAGVLAIVALAATAAIAGIEILHAFSHSVVTLARDGESFFQYRPVLFDPPKGKACDIYD
ncbi:hypothetical protein [Sphingomonas sp.]|uniref:hypothetical protein n=1 Tax=Sphingomonas sp. TaxID=28214 RepID=UPI003B3A6EBD